MFGSGIFHLAILPAALASSGAQAQPNAVQRLVAAVQTGQDLTAGEFAPSIKAEDAAKLAKVAKCIPAPPRTSGGDPSILVVWDCTAQPGLASVGTLIEIRNDKITAIFVMPAVIHPVSAQ